MRYRIGEDPAVAAYGTTPDWLWLWSVGLVISSLVYGGYELVGY